MAIPQGRPSHFAVGHGAPQRAVPQISRGRGEPERGRFATGGPRERAPANIGTANAREPNRPAASPAESRQHGLEAAKPLPNVNNAARQAPPEAGHETVGTTASRANDARAEQRRAPILRNPIFADQRAGRDAPSGQWTFRGRFAQSALHDDWRRHRHHTGIVLGFIGPLFWPYAYNDFVDYTYSPYAYDTFWPYAYDDVFAGIYGGYAPEYYAPQDAYAYAGSATSERVYGRAATSGRASQSAGADRICSGDAKGVTDFAIEKIAAQVNPDQSQKDLLDTLKAASVKAVDILQNACPGELPSTPTGRLAAMLSRVDAMLKAVETVRPALDAFYQSLNDEQRERFNALDQGEQAARAESRTDLNRMCQGQTTTKSDLPVDRIQRTLHLNADQGDRLKALDAATIDSAKMLQAQCQPEQTLTPTGRLAAMEDRLRTMSKALETTQAALNRFYGSLNDEQKAQFNRMNIRST
jgi:LTXXQ motif family protein